VSGQAATAYIGLGSNQQDPFRQLSRAMEEIAVLPGTQLLARSSLYLSEPVGYAGQPDFVNAVVEVSTSLDAQTLLAKLQDIEHRHGRERRFRNAPRTLDLDLLLYGGDCIEQPGLQVPHPRMHERAFVLAPLAEIAPAARVGVIGTAAQLLAKCAGQRVERMQA